MLQKLSKAQLREIQIGENYTNLFDNMPIIYMQERVVLDESGDPVDTVFCDVNRSFERSFYPKERIIGKKGSEIFPESMPEFLHFIRIAIAERRSILLLTILSRSTRSTRWCCAVRICREL